MHSSSSIQSKRSWSWSFNLLTHAMTNSISRARCRAVLEIEVTDSYLFRIQMCASLSKNAGRPRSLLPATIFATISSAMPAAFPASSTTRWTLCRMETRVWRNGTDPCSNLSDMKMSGYTAILKSALRIKTRARKSTCRSDILVRI